MTQCPWSIRWTFGRDTRCTKDAHVTHRDVQQLPDGRLAVDVEGDVYHEGQSGVMPGQVISWLAGDRREYEGEYPGPCTKLPGNACTLHTGHNGRCAP